LFDFITLPSEMSNSLKHMIITVSS